MPATATPTEHQILTSPTTSAHSAGSPGRRSFQSHGRSMSSATEVGPLRPNRFSTSFPVQTPRLGSPTRASHSPTRDAPPVVPEALASPTGPTDSSFLTALATQERRVLELKEELQRAEADLNKLKKQWAQHEASKKRNDARKVTKLQPLQTTLPATDKEEGEEPSSAWAQQEMERRKALLNGGKNSNRTVFSGSRHTRTLSLLSPAAKDDNKPMGRPILPPRKDSLSMKSQRIPHTPPSPQKRPPLSSRASTTADLTTQVAVTADPYIDLPDNLEKALDQDQFLRTGSRMASDLKNGLWTFFEDLRQATVGDETTHGMQVMPPSYSVRRQNSTVSQMSARTARKQGSSSSLRPGSKGLTSVAKSSAQARRPSPSGRKRTKSATQSALPDLADPGFWTEHSALPVQQAAIKKPASIRGHAKTASKGAISVTSNEGWDTWPNSPEDSRSSSAASDAATLASTISGPTSPRPSVGKRKAERKDPIPWPALRKLGPATLRRTASNLMSEWEKPLIPSPGTEFKGDVDYMGMGAEAAALGGGSGARKGQ